MADNVVKLPITTAQMRTLIKEKAEEVGLDVQCSIDGTVLSEVAIVAEAPGESEVARRVPLIGTSGSLLFQVLRQSKFLGRSEFYLTNVSKRQVSFGSDKRRPINRHEQDLWNDILLWELSQLPNLKYIVALGNFALTALTGNEGITQWRGSVLTVALPNGRQVQVICTYNPAMILREPKLEVIFRHDLSKLRRVMDGKHKVPVIETHINPTYDEANDFIYTIRKEAQQHGTPISFDLEVVSMETACIGFANNANTAMCINWRTMDQHTYNVEKERTLRKRISELFADTRVKFIAQNAMFDMTWLWYKDAMRVHGTWLDTMLAHHALYPILPHNLGFLTTQYTDHPYYKDEKSDWREKGNIDDFWRYNGKDCCLTWTIAQKLEKELQREGMHKFFHEHVMRLQPVLARMTVSGIKMDLELREKIKEELTDAVARKRNEFVTAVHSALGTDDWNPNPNSPRDLSDLFFRHLKLVGRGTSTDSANRQRMYDHPRTSDEAKRIITALNDYAKDRKFLSTYIDTNIDADGRARTEYKQTGVQSAPGRLSSGATMWGSGGNMQNQPQQAYPMFIADEGYSLVYFDMAQAEARLVAFFANIDKWKEQFERARIDGSYDAHRALASEMFGIPYDEVPAYDRDKVTHEPTLRFTAKRCRHGLNYRMAPDRLAQTTGLPLGEAHKAYNAYHRITPELRRWWGALEKEVRDTKRLFNAFGRRLLILERITPEALESIVAFKPQSTLGDHVCQVMYKAEQDERWPEHSRMWLNNHDALIAMVPHDKALTALSIMKEHAEKPIIINGDKLIIPADCKISQPDEQGIHRWSTLKGIKL